MMLKSQPSFNILETFISGSEIIPFIGRNKVDIILWISLCLMPMVRNYAGKSRKYLLKPQSLCSVTV
jgi:hypothetical protein